jgi:hypothetical protein
MVNFVAFFVNVVVVVVVVVAGKNRQIVIIPATPSLVSFFLLHCKLKFFC